MGVCAEFSRGYESWFSKAFALDKIMELNPLKGRAFPSSPASTQRSKLQSYQGILQSSDKWLGATTKRIRMRLPRSFPEMKADGSIQRNYGKKLLVITKGTQVPLARVNFKVEICYLLCAF